MKILTARLLLALLVGAFALNSSPVLAQQDQVPLTENQPVEAGSEQWYELESIAGNVEVGDFVVGPGRAEVSVRPGQTVTTEISVTNRISGNREFSLVVEDIEGSRDGSSISTLNGNQSPRGIVDFISFPEDSLNLNLGQRARIPVTITVPENTSPGGYFGAVMVSTVRNAQVDSDLTPRSPIIARVASLIFLTVEGEVIESGNTVSLDTINNNRVDWWYESGPIDFGLLFENSGTVHLNPYGEVSITNMLGEEVGYIQLEPWFILPNGLRLREFTWDREFLFGRYVVEAQINRGYNDEIDVVTTSFWVLPWRLVGLIFIVIFVIIFAVRTFFKKFEFKRKEN